MLRPSIRLAAGGGGLVAAGLFDRALTPQARPLSTAAAAAGTIGKIRLYQYEVCTVAAALLAHPAASLTRTTCI